MTHGSVTSGLFSKLLVISMVISFNEQGFVLSSTFKDHFAGESSQAGFSLDAKEQIPPNLKSVVGCRLGKAYRNYPECRCGEYIVRVPKKDIPPEYLGEYYVKTVSVNFKKDRRIYYTCFFCSRCPDGVRTTTNCTARQDTQCSLNNECVDPTHVFDMGRKACIRNPLILQTTERTTSVQNQHGRVFTQTQKTNTYRFQPDDDANNSGTTKTNLGSAMVIGTPLLIVLGILVFAMITVLLVNIRICLYFRKDKRRNDEEQERMISSTPSSSTRSITTV